MCEMRTGDRFALIDKVHCSLKTQFRQRMAANTRDILLLQDLDTSKGTVRKLKY